MSVYKGTGSALLPTLGMSTTASLSTAAVCRSFSRASESAAAARRGARTYPLLTPAHLSRAKNWGEFRAGADSLRVDVL